MSEEWPSGSSERPEAQPPGYLIGRPPGSKPQGPKPFWRRTPFLMAAPPLALVMIITIVAACGGTATHSSAAAGSPSASAGSPSAAAGSPSAAPSPLDATTQREVCADVEAQVIADGSASGQAEESLYKISYAQVVATVAAQCPGMSKFLTPF
jgi:hypothetical protein